MLTDPVFSIVNATFDNEIAKGPIYHGSSYSESVFENIHDLGQLIRNERRDRKGQNSVETVVRRCY